MWVGFGTGCAWSVFMFLVAALGYSLGRFCGVGEALRELHISCLVEG